MSNVQDLFDQMGQRFNAGAAAGVDEVFQYDIEGAGTWQVSVANGECSVATGDDADASVTLSMSPETLEGVMSGEVDGMQAFMTGSIKASGDIMLATRLNDLFPTA